MRQIWFLEKFLKSIYRLYSPNQHTKFINFHAPTCSSARQTTNHIPPLPSDFIPNEFTKYRIFFIAFVDITELIFINNLSVFFEGARQFDMHVAAADAVCNRQSSKNFIQFCLIFRLFVFDLHVIFLYLSKWQFGTRWKSELIGRFRKFSAWINFN